MIDPNTPEAVSNRTGLPLSDVYRDSEGRTEPPAAWYGPGHVYVGSLRRGRVCFDTTGRRMKVLRQGEGSTLVRLTEGKRKVIKGRSFIAPVDPITISSSTVVRFSKEAIRS